MYTEYRALASLTQPPTMALVAKGRQELPSMATAAADLGIVQELLIRVSAAGDIFFDAQEGGFGESEVPAVVEALSRLRHVCLVEMTAFPCVRYNHRADERSEATPNLHIILRGAEAMRSMGVEVRQINTPATPRPCLWQRRSARPTSNLATPYCCVP